MPQEISIYDIQNLVGSLFENGENLQIIGKKPFFAKRIISLIDLSGSTNGFISGTNDPIIVSEIKGIIITIHEIMKKYDLTGTKFNFIVYGSYAKEIYDFIGESNSYINTKLQNIVEKIDYLYSLTNLQDALNIAFAKIDTDTHIIVSMDGKPNVGGSEKDIINYFKNIKDNSDKYQNITFNFIGTGSITEMEGGSEYFINTGSDINQFISENKKESLFQLKSRLANNNVESIDFILDMMDGIKYALYSPASNDYSILRTSLDLFLKEQKKEENIKYKVYLDNIVIDVLNSAAQYISEKGNAIIYIIRVHSWYYYNENYQLAIKPVDDNKNLDTNNIYYCDVPNNLQFALSYKDAMSSKKITPFQTSGGFFVPLVDQNGYWRCRKVESYK